VFVAVSDQIRSPSSSAWLLVKSTEEMLGGLTGRIQKQGSTEAGPVGRKRYMLFSYFSLFVARQWAPRFKHVCIMERKVVST